MAESEEQEWVEAPGGWGESSGDDNDDGCEESGFDLFADNDPQDSFSFTVSGSTAATTTKLHLSGFKLDSDETAQSTGVTLWKESPRLATYIQEAKDELIVGKSVLELGAGLGLCGIVSHHLGADRVIMTDADTITLQQMRENVAKNCPETITNRTSTAESPGIIDCRQLIWNTQLEAFHEKHGKFDTILGAAVIYTRDSIDPLFDTVSFFLQKSQGRFVLSRWSKWGGVTDEDVLEYAKDRNLTWTQPSEGIFVMQMKKEDKK